MIHAFGYSKSLCGIDADDIPDAEILTQDFEPVTCLDCLAVRDEIIRSGKIYYVLGGEKETWHSK